MSPQAGNLLFREVAPRIKSAARHCINFVGSEDYEEVAQEAIYEQKNRLAKSIKEFMGEDVLALVMKQPEWKSNLRAMREKHTCTFAD